MKPSSLISWSPSTVTSWDSKAFARLDFLNPGAVAMSRVASDQSLTVGFALMNGMAVGFQIVISGFPPWSAEPPHSLSPRTWSLLLPARPWPCILTRPVPLRLDQGPLKRIALRPKDDQWKANRISHRTGLEHQPSYLMDRWGYWANMEDILRLLLVLPLVEEAM